MSAALFSSLQSQLAVSSGVHTWLAWLPWAAPATLIAVLLCTDACCGRYCDCGTLFKVAQAWQPAAEDDRQMVKRLLLLHDVVRGLE